MALRNSPANQYYSQPISFGLIPKEGPKFIPAKNIPATPSPGYLVDLTTAQQTNQMSMVQTIFVDNTGNTEPVLVAQTAAGESISVPAGDQGYYPILVSGDMKFTVTSSGSGVVNVSFINVLVQGIQWSGLAAAPVIDTPLPVSDAILDGTVVGGRQLVTNQTNYTTTDHSGTILVGGTAQNATGANAARQGWLIQNIDEANLEPLYVSVSGAAQSGGAAGSFTCVAGGGAGLPGGTIQGTGTAAISVVAATAGHAYTLITW